MAIAVMIKVEVTEHEGIESIRANDFKPMLMCSHARYRGANSHLVITTPNGETFTVVSADLLTAAERCR